MAKQIRLSEVASRKLDVLVAASPGMTIGAVVDMAFGLVTPRALQAAVVTEMRRKMKGPDQPVDTSPSGSDRTAAPAVAPGRSGGQGTRTTASDRPEERSDPPAAPAVGAGRSRSPEQGTRTANTTQQA